MQTVEEFAAQLSSDPRTSIGRYRMFGRLGQLLAYAEFLDRSTKWESSLTTTHGRTLFLLHSLGLDAESWTLMVEAARPLMPGADLVPIDLIGHGTASDTAFVVEAAATEVIDTARGRGTEGPLHLVGSGLGALIALHIAARSPSEVGSLVLAGWPPTAPSAGRSRAELVAAALAANGAKAFADDYLEQLGTNRDVREALANAIVMSSARGLVAGIAAAEAWRPPATAVSAFPPCLIIRGARDIRVSEQAARQFAVVLDGRFAGIADAGHLAYVDRPRPFADAVADFHAGLA